MCSLSNIFLGKIYFYYSFHPEKFSLLNLRNFCLSFGLLTMDTRASENRKVVLSIEEEAQSTKMFEAFLEAAPQFILQLSILLQTGDYGNLLIN